MVDWSKLQYLKQEKILKFQDKILRSFIRNNIPYHPYYHSLFKKNRIKLSDIKNLDDLKKLPFTTKNDLIPTKKNSKKFLDFVLQPDKNLIKRYATIRKKIENTINKKQLYYEYNPIHIHFTTGRSSNSIPVLYTAYDLKRLEESGNRMIELLNISNKDVAVNTFPYAPHLAFWQTFYALKSANILSLHTGGGKVFGSEKIISSIESMKANCLVGMPGYLYHLVRTANEEKRDFSNVNLIIFGGEKVPLGLRNKLRDYLISMGSKNLRILSTYAFTESKSAWVECKEESGYHLYPDFEFIEVVDKNNERVGEGEKGEIVYTSLDWRGSVFLRYKTGDVTKGVYYEKCSCGRNLPRIDNSIERSSEHKKLKLTKIKGSFVNLNIFFEVMMSHPEIEEWQVEISKKNNDPYEIDKLILYVATKNKSNFEKVKRELENKITAETEVTPEIVKIGLNELLERLGMESELKEKRILDRRF